MQQVSKMDDMQKIDHLTKRSSDLLAEMRRLDKENQKNKKRGDILQKERDANRSELSRTLGLKEKLEKLCRELQKDNNKMKVRNSLGDVLLLNPGKLTQLRTRTRRYKPSRSVITWLGMRSTQRCCPSWSGIKKKRTPHESRLWIWRSMSCTSVLQRQMVTSANGYRFRVRFKSFIEQYELRELHFHSQMRTKELEVQYHLARFERERKSAEGETTKSRHLQAQVHAFTKTETELRNQLNVYVDKFKQVEDTLNNSNDLFLSFRKEMEDMSKKGKRLEKENEALKRQKEATAANIIRMAEERQDWKGKIDMAEKKTEKLMSIIQQMQQQGRKIPAGMSTTVEQTYPEGREHDHAHHDHAHGDDSDYSDEGEGEGSEFDDDTEEEVQPSDRVQYGPERPPVLAQAATTNGH